VDCTPPGNLIIRVQQFRASAGGYLKISPWQTAGIAAVKSIDFKSSSADVSQSRDQSLTHVLLICDAQLGAQC
jgi:hypothetical protein